MFFLQRIIANSHGVSVPFRAIPLLSYFVYGFLHRSLTDVFCVSPCHSVAMIFCLCFFASEFHGYSRMFSVRFRCTGNCVWCWLQPDLHGSSVCIREVPLLWNKRGMDVDKMSSMRNIMYEFSWQHGASYFAYSLTKRPIVANSPKISHFLYSTENQYITSKHLHQEPTFRAFLSQKHCYKGEICMLLHA